MTTLEITNPADGSRLAEVPADDAASVAAKAARARAAQPAWAALPLAERVAAIARFRAAVAAGIETLARTLTQEVGKPLAQSRNELNGFLGRIDFFLAEVAEASAPETVFDDGDLTERIDHDPLGVVANVSAWNYPYFVGGNVFVPALLTGNAVLYKPSEFATLTGLHIDRLLDERRADLAAADEDDEDVLGNPRRMEQPRDLQPGQRRELRRLVEHGVAGEQRRNEDVAADEIGVVPRRDVGDDPERFVPDPLRHRRIGVDLGVGRARVDLGEEEIDAAEKAVQLVARLRDRLADLGSERLGQRFQFGDDFFAKSRDHRLALGERAARPARLRGAGACRLSRDAGRIVGGHFGDDRAVRRIDDRECLRHVLCAARAWARKSSSRGRSSSVPSPAR